MPESQDQWEYCTEWRDDVGPHWDSFIELVCERLGREGWELVHVTERKRPDSEEVHLKGYFKRRKPVGG